MECQLCGAVSLHLHCVKCGAIIDREDLVKAGLELCSHHPTDYPVDWAPTNRMACDMLHRGIIPPRPVISEDEPWAYVTGVAECTSSSAL